MENTFFIFVLGMFAALMLVGLVYTVVIVFRTKKLAIFNQADVISVNQRIDETISREQERWDEFHRDYDKDKEDIYRNSEERWESFVREYGKNKDDIYREMGHSRDETDKRIDEENKGRNEDYTNIRSYVDKRVDQLQAKYSTPLTVTGPGEIKISALNS